MLEQIVIDQLKDTLREGIANRELAGANLLVIKDGQELLYHEDGMADIEAGIPMRRDAIFRMYSFTKPITAAAAMILLERGKIDLFDPVSKFLPGFRKQLVEENGELVPANRNVHLLDLLSMTSGLIYGGSNRAGRETEALIRDIERGMLSDSPLTTLEAMNRLGAVPLAAQPGARWHYGTSSDVMGAVIEVVSGMRFGEFLQKELFEPLGMIDTSFWLTDDKKRRLVRTYKINREGELVPFKPEFFGDVSELNRPPAFESGGAGLVSTIDDASRFTRMLLGEGALDGVRVLRPRTVRYMTTAALSPEQRQGMDYWDALRGYSYGNFMRIMIDSTRAGVIGCDGEYGWDGWLGTYFCNCPKENLSFVFMMQMKDAGTTPLTRKLRNIVLSGL